MIRFYLLLITFSLCQLLPAQDHYPCGAVEMQKKLFSIDKKWQELQERSEQLLVKKKGGLVANRANELFTLPVVVHVIHNNGSENISDIQIDQALANLNAAFSHSGPYKSKGEGFNTEIQFCLARRTFDNNATTGVNRIVSGLTNLTMETEDQALKNLSRWDPSQYINIWVVNEISSQSQGSGVAGYAYLAGMHGKPLDGLVCEAKFFGKSPSDDVVLIHEMGHYLNLLHTFDGGCTNNFCDQEGDKVCDTPPDQALHSSCVFNSCGTDKNDSRAINPFTTDVNDMTQNYMDYSPFECQFAFTKGQAERMRLTIQNIRESLLQSQGCLSPCVSTITGGISAPQEAVTGQNVNLSFSGTGATTYVWSVDGTQISTSSAQDYVFTTPGTYTIALVAGNQDVNCVYKTKHTITVKCNISADFNPTISEIKAGENITFTSTGTGGKDYIWKIDETQVGTGSSIDYTFPHPKDYLIQLQVSNEYCSQTKTGKVVVQSACGDSIWQYQITNDKDYEYFTAPLNDGSFYYSATADNLNSRLVGLIDKNGEHKWSNSYSAPNSSRPVPYILSDGGLLILENLSNASNSFISATKFNQNGDKLWSSSYNIPSVVYFHAIPVKDGILITFGYYLLYLNNDGQVKWSKIMPTIDDFITSAQKTENENHIWALGHGLENGIRKMKLIKLDLDGNILNSFFITPSQNIQLGHRFLGSFNDGSIALHLKHDINPMENYIICVGKTGVILWQKKYNGILNSINTADNKLLITAYKLPERQYEMVILDANGTKLISAVTTEKNLTNQNYISSIGSLWVIPMTWQKVTTFINLNSNAIQANCLIKSSNFDIQNESGWTTEPFNSLPFLSAQVQRILPPTVIYSPQQTPVLNICRIPNPCPKNCNDEVSHLKLNFGKPISSFYITHVDKKNIGFSGYSSDDGTGIMGLIDINGAGDVSYIYDEPRVTLLKRIEYKENIYLAFHNNDIFSIRKEDKIGNIIFFKEYRAINSFHNFSIVNDEIIILTAQGDFHKIDLNGKVLWSKQTDQSAMAIVEDGIWFVPFIINKEISFFKVNFDGVPIISKKYKLNLDSINGGLWRCKGTSSNGLIIAISHTISNIPYTMILSINPEGQVNFASSVIDNHFNNGLFAENADKIVFSHFMNGGLCFSFFDENGNLSTTKSLLEMGSNDELTNNIVNYKSGWIAACTGNPKNFIVYLSDRPEEDCLLKPIPNNIVSHQVSLMDSEPFKSENIINLPNEVNANQPPLKIIPFVKEQICTTYVSCIEICDNGIDDDDNGLIDCSDLSCPCNTCLNKADLVLSSIDSIRCIGNEYMATLTICNKGDKDFNGSVPVTFYNGNPWGKSVSALSTSLQFVGSLEKDSCAQVTYRFTKYRDGDIYAVINAGENLVTPYDENTFFDDVDCNLTNNTKSILFAPSIPTLDLGPDVEICRGQVVNLSAQEGFSSYNWQDFNPNKNYTAFTQGLYAVTVSDYCGNTQKDEIHIKEKKLVPIQLGEDKLICQGTSLEINLNPPANGKFVWDDGIEGAYRKLNSSGSYTLGFYTPENCVVKDTIEVVVIPAPVLSIEDSISICEGSTYTVVLADIDMKYNWYDGDTSSTKVFNQAGIYSVSASNEACTVQDSIQIDIINKPQINLPDSLSFCTGDSIRLSVQPQQSASYFWNTGEQTPDIVVKNSGTYILEANIKNCTSSDTVLVQEFFRPEISLQPIITACQGDTIALNVNINPDQTILWSNGNTTNSTLISESGTYTVQISNKSCIASDTSEVTFFEKPIANLAEQLHGCEGKILQLELSVKPMEEIIWYDGTKDTLKQFDKSGLYSLTIKNEHCATLDTVQVTFHELPESFDLGKDTTLCDDLQLDINVVQNENYLYEWNDGVSSASRNISETGLYSLKVENRYGCIEADSIQVIFVPQPEFSLGMDTSICKGDSFNINLILPENSIITWNDQSMERNRTLFNPGLYTATLDYYGCQTSDDIEIYVNDCNPFEIYLPNVFRYNSAVNGLFKPVINGDTYSISDYIMTIFDRWGNLVFKSSDPEIGWDGTYLGQPSESGVYIYILNVVFKDHSEPIRLEKQGSITLLK